MAVRKRLTHDMKTREKIQTSQIINRLEKHILAKPEQVDGEFVVKDLMTQSQVTAALGLIKKTLPDLVAVDHSGEVTINDAKQLSDADLLNIATGSSTGATKQTDSPKKPDSLH